MQVVFATVSKKVNSTLRFSGGTTYDCVLKDGCSVVRPRISLKWPGSGAPTAYNVAYISAFGRYYFIDDWTFADRQWSASMHSDVLASAKDQIGSASKYVLRSASAYNADVVDSKYPAKAGVTTHTVAAATALPWVSSYANGMIVVGIIGQGNTYSPGGVGYVSMAPNTFNNLINGCFNASGQIWGSSSLGTDVPTALNVFGQKMQQSIQNPFQFINSARWYPFSYTGSTNFSAKLGYMDTGVTVNALPSPTAYHTQTFTLNPTLNGSDAWMNISPFTEYLLSFPPFGNFELNSAQLQGATSLICTVETDLTTGLAILRVTATKGVNNVPILMTSGCKLGVDMELGGNSVNYATAGSSLLSGIGAAVGAVLMPTPGSIAGAASAVGNLAGSLAPTAHSSGAQGSMAGLFTQRVLQIFTRQPVDQDVTDQGRPLCEIQQISTLSGFTLCADGHIDAPFTSGELDEIESYLTGGFYYE